jgi:hypothetical protein
MSHIIVPIQEEFDDPQGGFENYDAYDTDQRFALANQRHVDIRNFRPDAKFVTVQMIHLDQMTNTDANVQQMDDLSGAAIIRQPEQWTEGTLDQQADRNNWNGISLDLTTGSNTTTSVIRE